MGEAQVEVNVTAPPREPFLLSATVSVGNSGFNNSLNMTICPESSSFPIGPPSASSSADMVTTSSPSGRQENEYFKELAELLQDTLSRPDTLQGVNKPALMDLIKQLHQQAKDRKENAVQHEDVSSSGPILLASHVGPMILEALDGFFFVMNTDGFVEYVSQNVVKYLKYNQVDMLNKPIYNFVAPNDHDLFSRLLPDSMGWHFIGFNSAPTAKERRSHKFMCRFTVNGETASKPTSNSSNALGAGSSLSSSSSSMCSIYENLQVSAISLPYPTDTHRDDDFSLSFNVTTDSQPCLVCVARRLPEKCNPVNSSYDGCQFSMRCTPEGEIVFVDFKDKSLKQLFPKDLHCVQLRNLCHSFDLSLLNSHLKEVIESGSHSLSQIRFISPVANSFCLLLQARSRFCTDNNVNVGFHSPNYLQMDFTVLRLVDCASSNSAIGIESKGYATTSMPPYNVSSYGGSNYNFGYGNGNNGNQIGNAPSLSSNASESSNNNNNANFDVFNDMFFADDYALPSNNNRNASSSSLQQHLQPPILFPQQNPSTSMVSPKHTKLIHTSKSSTSFDINSASTPATPVSSSTVPGTPVRCPSALSEPVSSTGQDDLQRICQMFSISGDDYSSFVPQQAAPSSTNFVDYSNVGRSNEIEYDKQQNYSFKTSDQHVILKELLNQDEEQQQIGGTHFTPSNIGASSSVVHQQQHLPLPSPLPLTLPPPPPPPPPPPQLNQVSAVPVEKPAKGRRGGGGRKNAKKTPSTQILEQLLKPEPSPAPPTPGSWCTSPVIKQESNQTTSMYGQSSNMAPPQILQQLLQDDEPAAYSQISSSGSILGKRKTATTSLCTYDASSVCGVSSPPTLVSSSTPSHKTDSLLVKLLEKPSSQTRSLPTSIASTHFDKMAKENKENPNKPSVQTLIVESLLQKTKPHSSKHVTVSTPSNVGNGQIPSSPLPSTSMTHFPIGPPQQQQHSPFISQGYHVQTSNMSVPSVSHNYGASTYGEQPPFMDPRIMEQMQYSPQSMTIEHRPHFEMNQHMNQRQFTMPPRFPTGSLMDVGVRSVFSSSVPSSSSSSSSSSSRFAVTPTPANVRQQILIQQQKRGKQHRQNTNNHNQLPYSAGPIPQSTQSTAFPLPGYHCSAPTTPTAPSSSTTNYSAPYGVQQAVPVSHFGGMPPQSNPQNGADTFGGQHFAMDPRFVQLPHQQRLPQSMAPLPPPPPNVPTSELVRHELRQSLQNRSHQQMVQSSVGHSQGSVPGFGLTRSISMQQTQPQPPQNWPWPERRYSQDYGNLAPGSMDSHRLGHLPGFPGASQFPQPPPSDQQPQQMQFNHRNQMNDVPTDSNGAVTGQGYDCWWNVDVGLDNGLDMDDESTQNLLQMLRNS